MRDLLTALARWQQDGLEIALATLVRVSGSAPRPPGARLAVTRGGAMVGSVSAGCVENDVFARALCVLDEGCPVVARYGIAEEVGFAVGLACGGTIEVLIERFEPGEAWRVLSEAVLAQRPVALATAVEPELLAGRKLAVLAGGVLVGDVDPDLDPLLRAAAERRLLGGGAELLRLPWRGGQASVLVEGIAPARRLFVVGATQIAVALCRMARVLGLRTTVVDARGPFAVPERFPEAEQVLRDWPDEVLGAAGLDAGSAVVVLSHDPKFDVPALGRALRSEAGYIGALGSRRTQERRLVKLREQGFGERDLARIRAPIGLDLGGREPEEVALAILAEVQAVWHGRDGRALCEGSARIHGERS